MSMNQAPPPKSSRELLKLKRPISVAIYDEYVDAAHAVDYLADRQFPVENLVIVGTDLKSIEKVTGNITWGKVLLAGFLQGAMWAGMFAVFMWLLQPQLNLLNTLAMAFAGFGLVGMGMAAIQYRLRGRDRDYTSTTTIIATHYEVLAEADVADRARHLLSGGAAHQTRAIEAHPRAQSVVVPGASVDLSTLLPPYGQQPSPDPTQPEAQDEAGQPGEGPLPARAQRPVDMPYGQYWDDDEPPGIGDVPKGFEQPKRTARSPQ